MVQLVNSEKENEKEKRKLETDDSLEDQLGYLDKKAKLDAALESVMSTLPSMDDLLDEPPPLGLKLTKSPSFIALIEATLSQSQGNNTKLPTESLKKDHKVAADKLKASNFPVSLLRIGTWECKSKYEGDLMAKCYYAKHKLVWEILDGSLKNKIEVRWSDIEAIKANYPDDGPGTLDLMLARRPKFFRETNPQPRKHTVWHETSDFTGGQASIHRQHFLQCPEGMLAKHLEKIIQCYPRLKFLSQQPEIPLEFPYFEPQASALNATNGSISRGAPPSGVSSALENERQESLPELPENISNEAPSPRSDMSAGTEESNLLRHPDQIQMSESHQSVEMNDPVSVIGNCISEQKSSGNPAPLLGNSQCRPFLEKVTHLLLGDSQLMSTSDEQSVMSKANSFCSLLQMDPGTTQISIPAEQSATLRINSLCFPLQKDPTVAENLESKVRTVQDAQIDENKNLRDTQSVNESAGEDKISRDFPSQVSDDMQGGAMSREDSIEELLHNLPRIASLQEFLFDITEESNTAVAQNLESKASEGEIPEDFSAEGKSCHVSDEDQDGAISGNESVGELLHNLPRIASLPHLLTKESDNREKW
ncbi:uncharacterized protein LOC120011513 [Tripterygium wilfordii]|uniref:uncharacterized protein LOC120011513 n=1 Tax=Tripterygium wilfordii TaxID=458696 RepID=UPI0018F82A8F|nr:uncharacterized protein LOC120011513 [Tripterygium wilfordii]